MQLTDLDRLLVDETLEEIEAEPPSRDLGPLGAPMVLFGLLIVIGFLLVGRVLPTPPSLAVAGLAAGAVLMIVGIFLAVAGGGLARGRPLAAAEAALRQLEGGDEDREVLIRAATLLLAHAYVSYGPTTTSSFDRAAAERRIEARLALVLEVEAHLLKSDRVYPVFTFQPGHVGWLGPIEDE